MARKPNEKFMRPMSPDDELAKVIERGEEREIQKKARSQVERLGLPSAKSRRVRTVGHA